MEAKSPQTVSVSESTLKGYLYELCLKYELDYQLLEDVITCESGWNVNAVGDSGKAVGLAQFWRGTFNQYCAGDYKNPFAQLNCFAEMMYNGKEKHWTCYRKVANNQLTYNTMIDEQENTTPEEETTEETQEETTEETEESAE